MPKELLTVSRLPGFPDALALPPLEMPIVRGCPDPPKELAV
jgi:hypothetical protein